MKRRNFVKNSLLATPTLLAATTVDSASKNFTKYDFRLKYAPHLGMFKNHAGNDPIEQLIFMADQGFTAFEDNNMKNRPIDMQEKMAKTMTQLGISMGVFVAHKIFWKEPNLASGKEEWRNEFLQQIKESVKVAKRVNAKWMTVVPGHLDLKQDMGYQMINVMDTLKRACEILEPHNLTMVLEPLNFRDHPGLFLTESAQAYAICKGVGSPSCKILFDIYHQQIQEGNLLPNIEKCWDEIAYFQIGDNPGRNEPTSGEINYTNIFKYIHKRGFKGILGMEHGNSSKGKEGELAVIKAYQKSDQY
ncbi:MAG: TIM barrel protein [Saprospiraceae bacterium]|jgi:hydroxypyruvate isomerase|nr:TIM barrel protein [Saprospiraceae bacterium]MDB4769180.1 TIM barrel protein [Saprospiraceae bacterium]MDC3219601.1 TIM barrel protein [Saprospiraceae bacterium]MDG1432443.1 TIM barrel protein [Saprospiraceae bacterium]MDG2418470.1 TIM barrel protein [Saprospiraceae bacterium]